MSKTQLRILILPNSQDLQPNSQDLQFCNQMYAHLLIEIKKYCLRLPKILKMLSWSLKQWKKNATPEICQIGKKTENVFAWGALKLIFSN